MAFSPRLWVSLLLASYCLPCVNAAPVNPSAILAQLKSSGACCTALNYFLPGKVHFNLPTDLAYQTSQASYWSAQEQSLQPTCIVTPSSTQNVSVAVTILSLGFQTKIKGCQFAVRSAGHTPHAGSANIGGGVTIDLQSLNDVTVSSDQKIVSLGPGNRWGNVYPKLDALGLAMVGGRVSTVGVGGLVTGGGVSFFSGRYGFACDNIVTFEVVLANGTITTASSTTNPTLFRALKGGSNNFGIVTRFDAKLFSQSPYWGGFIFQPIENKEAVFEFISNFTVSATYDPYSALITSFAWVAGIPTIEQNAVYTNGDVAWPPPAFKALQDMPKVTQATRKDTTSSFATELEAAAALTNGHNNIFVTATVVNKPGVTQDFLAEVYELSNAAAQELISVVGLIFTCAIQPLPNSIYSKSAATGGNVLGLDRFKNDLINVLYTVSWTLPTDNARMEVAMKDLEADIEAKAKEMGIYNEWIYLNYAAGWQDPIIGYGATNVAFMKGVSKKYDPNGIFQKAVPGGFKLHL